MGKLNYSRPQFSRPEYFPMVSYGKCEKCHAHLYAPRGRFGDFLGCSRFPNCKFTRQLHTNLSPSGSRSDRSRADYRTNQR